MTALAAPHVFFLVYFPSYETQLTCFYEQPATERSAPPADSTLGAMVLTPLLFLPLPRIFRFMLTFFLLSLITWGLGWNLPLLNEADPHSLLTEYGIE